MWCVELFLFGTKVAFATFGVDVSAECGVWSCLHNTDGAQFMITRGWQSYGAFDSTSIPNLQNARSAGIEYTDVYMFPCRGMSASTQMIDLINDLKANSPKKQMFQLVSLVQKDFVQVIQKKKKRI